MFDPGEQMSPKSAEVLQRWIDALGKVPFHRESDLHGRAHCARVLVHCIRISEELGMCDADRESLCACAVYHDSRRFDDWYDVGHGERGAENYEECFRALGREPDPRASMAMRFHDREDIEGESAIRSADMGDDAVLMYHVLKDADGLDRCRLGTDGLDPKYLRTAPAKSMIIFAQQLFESGYGIGFITDGSGGGSQT